MKLKETFKMKINSKLMLITATLGLMAAASSTAFASDTYIHFTNNSNQTITVKKDWIETSDKIHAIQSSCVLPPNGQGSIVVRANQSESVGGGTEHYAIMHVKYDGHNEDMVIARFDCGYSGHGLKNPGLAYSHLTSVNIGTSAYSELHQMGLSETITGAYSAGGTALCTTNPNQPSYKVYGIGWNYVDVTIQSYSGSTLSPLGKLSSTLKNFKL